MNDILLLFQNHADINFDEVDSVLETVLVTELNKLKSNFVLKKIVYH